MKCVIGGVVALACWLSSPLGAAAQSAPLPTRWEITLGGQVGAPSGDVKVGENDIPGTRLRLRKDLGVDVSEAAELRVAYHLTARDALAGSFLAFFLRGTGSFDQDVTFNGGTLVAGRNETNADFTRFTLAYERLLLPLGARGSLIGSAGLTYVHLNLRITGTGLGGTTEEGKEDFFRQELPVPLAGLRADYPLTDRLAVRASLVGGYLPWVNSLRSEGGTVRLTQSHTDAALGLTYALTSAWQLEGGYRFTYFFQHERSHEDDNAFQLIDNAIHLGVTYRF